MACAPSLTTLNCVIDVSQGHRSRCQHSVCRCVFYLEDKKRPAVCHLLDAEHDYGRWPGALKHDKSFLSAGVEVTVLCSKVDSYCYVIGLPRYCCIPWKSRWILELPIKAKHLFVRILPAKK